MPDSVAASTWAGTRPKPWTLTRVLDDFALVYDGQQLAIPDLPERTALRRSWLRHRIAIEAPDGSMLLGPLDKAARHSLIAALEECHLRRAVATDLAGLLEWSKKVQRVLSKSKRTGRWICEETIVDLERSRPLVTSQSLNAAELAPDVAAVLTEAETLALTSFKTDLRRWIADTNEEILSLEKARRRKFLRNIESSPLTDEQARAVLCFDNRVQVIASAGSGKTSVMVARAAYAIDRGFVAPSRVLLLAFNRDAANELQERVDTRLEAVGIPSAGVKASTFHSFGLSTIGQATGKKPRLASWLDGGGDVRMINRIVDELRDSSREFRFAWDIFRRLYARLGENDTDDEPDGWDKERRETGYRTANGDVVKSHGERLIADWLFCNHVQYRYEQLYSIDVATPDHSQYRPDFYYPDVGVWHEHWAVGTDGKIPPKFEGYAQSMRWKKELHRSHGTTLLETTWGEIQDPAALKRLAGDLRALGVELDWDPDRPTQGPPPMRHEELARLMRMFMAHVKANGLTRQAMKKRLKGARPGLRRPRTEMFLNLYWQIHDAWQQKLASENEVDFEDMLILAAEHLESGRAPRDYDLVLVDEFQDASQARARLIAGLVDRPGAFLLTVGDDWQAINRFAGADISVMSSFERWFGKSQTLRLETTFRCSAEICAVSSAFVAKNPAQLPKQVRAHDQSAKPRMNVISVVDRDKITDAVTETLSSLNDAVAAGELMPARGPRLSVFVLGRYTFDKDFLRAGKHPHLSVEFKTIHRSKGLEADHVIIPNLTRGTYGFPSSIADDAVLELAMPQPEEFDHAEERRLFYVAMTRARHSVTLVTVSGLESPFVVELINEGLVEVDASRVPTPAVVCPTCRTGTLAARSGPYGAFLGCTAFPKCRHTQKVDA